jgi:hypothetical protein
MRLLFFFWLHTWISIPPQVHLGNFRQRFVHKTLLASIFGGVWIHGPWEL